MARIAVIGAGYVGLTTAAGMAHLGHDVACSDVAAQRIEALRRGEVPFFEVGLGELVREGLSAGRLSFEHDNARAVRGAQYVFLCVPTPQGHDGRADMSFINSAARGIAPHLETGCVVITKSTVPVGSTKVVERALGRVDVDVVSNPEFLAEGSAVHDFLHPERIVIGADSEAAAVRVSSLFLHLSAPLIVTDPASAEVIKYASNAFLATKVSFINAMAALCEAVGADIRQVALGMGYDRRIGAEFLRAGPGWGGSCLPKDTAALLRIAEDAGYEFGLLRGVVSVNTEQYERVVAKAARLAGGDLAGAKVALWGLTFKAGTDDLRFSPALEVAGRLLAGGAQVAAYDPMVSGPLVGEPLSKIEVSAGPYAAAEGAKVLVVATEWDEFRWSDWAKLAEVMANKAVVDARNLLEPAALRRAGFTYEGIGHP
jgi:UDPglucose 6-dehydrogenase